MPELPEVQALAERLDAAVAGAALQRAVALQFSALKTVSPGPEDLLGRTTTGVSRRGKYVVMSFGGQRILLHLGQGGRLDIERPPKTTKPRGALVRLVFDNDTALLVKEFGTERRAGWWILGEGDDGPLAGLGPEPSDDAFADLLMGSDDARRLHTMLRDQRTVAGIGRGYVDDALHRARLSPFRAARSLDDAERRTLIDAIRSTLDEALAHERTRSGGLPTKMDDRFTIHRNAGTPCPRCGDDLRRVSYDSHEVVYCPACQTGGKILADRRMSRLIK